MRVCALITFVLSLPWRTGQGFGPLKQFVPVPVTSLASVKVVRVVAGENHAIALSDAGAVYTWGAGNHGQVRLCGCVCKRALFTLCACVCVRSWGTETRTTWACPKRWRRWPM